VENHIGRRTSVFRSFWTSAFLDAISSGTIWLCNGDSTEA
jgi:hypothetical protein